MFMSFLENLFCDYSPLSLFFDALWGLKLAKNDLYNVEKFLLLLPTLQINHHIHFTSGGRANVYVSFDNTCTAIRGIMMHARNPSSTHQ